MFSHPRIQLEPALKKLDSIALTIIKTFVMTNTDLQSIFQILSKVSFIPVEEINSETDIFEDLNVDSLGMVETLVELEKHFGLVLKPGLVTRDDIQTPEKILQLVVNTSKALS